MSWLRFSELRVSAARYKNGTGTHISSILSSSGSSKTERSGQKDPSTTVISNQLINVHDLSVVFRKPASAVLDPASEAHIVAMNAPLLLVAFSGRKTLALYGPKLIVQSEAQSVKWQKPRHNPDRYKHDPLMFGPRQQGYLLQTLEAAHEYRESMPLSSLLGVVEPQEGQRESRYENDSSEIGEHGVLGGSGMVAIKPLFRYCRPFHVNDSRAENKTKTIRGREGTISLKPAATRSRLVLF